MATFVRTQSIAHRIGAAGRLAIGVTEADVGITAVDGDEARIRATFEFRAADDAEADAMFEAAQLRVNRGGASLQVEQPDDHPSLRGAVSALERLLSGRGPSELSLRVELPRNAELRLSTVSGDVDGTGLHGEQRFQTVSGDLTLVDAGGDLRINSVSGDAHLRADAALALRAESVSGDLAVSTPRLEALRATTVSGDVEIEAELTAGGEFRAETVSGDLVVGLVGGATFEVRGLSTDISSDLDHRVEGRHDRRRLVIGGGGPSFLFSSMSGDISVRRPRRLNAAERPPAPPAPPAPPTPPAPLSRDEQLDVLQALERGEIDVEEATRRLGGGRG